MRWPETWAGGLGLRHPFGAEQYLVAWPAHLAT